MENSIKQIDKIFLNKNSFEKEILGVNSESDKSEIMKILSKTIVDETLKEHLSFLYIKDLSDFTLKHVVNILFKEIANEWIVYAMEDLHLSKQDALEELQVQSRVKLIHSLSADYYKHYKDSIFEEISESFIDLLGTIRSGSDKIVLVNAVINSDLIANRTILGINSFDQLYKKVKTAKNKKTSELSSLQMKIIDIKKEISNPTTDRDKKESLLAILPNYEKKVQEISEMRLESFEVSLQRVKRAIFNSLKNGLYKI
ncbi:hypothetical protein [Sulfurimonas sp.]